MTTTTATAVTVAFVNSTIAIFSDGSYVLARGRVNMRPMVGRRADRWLKAQRARELGLVISDEMAGPEFLLQDGVARGGTREQIERRLEESASSLEFNPAWSPTTCAVRHEFLCGDSCHSCGGCCPTRMVEVPGVVETRPAWAPTIPLPREWMVPMSNVAYRVQTDDGKWYYSGDIAGTGGSGTLVDGHLLDAHGVNDPEVFKIAQRAAFENELRRKKYRKETAEKEADSLRRFFGL